MLDVSTTLERWISEHPELTQFFLVKSPGYSSLGLEVSDLIAVDPVRVPEVGQLIVGSDGLPCLHEGERSESKGVIVALVRLLVSCGGAVWLVPGL